MAYVENRTVFARNLEHYIDENNVKKKDVAAAAKVSTGTVSDWLNGRSYPRIGKIQLLAEFFHIEKTDLIEEHSFTTQIYLARKSNDVAKELSKNPENLEIYLLIKKLSLKDRKIVKELLKSLGEKNNG